MVDKVRPLKIEEATDGTQIDFAPTETNPSQDFLAAKGIALENSDNTTIAGVSGVMEFKDVQVPITSTLKDAIDRIQKKDVDLIGLTDKHLLIWDAIGVKFKAAFAAATNVLFSNTIAQLPNNPTNVQTAIEQLKTVTATSASPGFSWGRSGNIPSGTWLLNDGVPANRSGRTVMMSTALLERISVATEDINTYSVEVYEHDGNEINLTLLHTVNVTATRSQQFNVPAVAVSQGRQMAVKLGTGSAKNLVIGVILKGTA